ncbi:MAG TPA: phosphatase PAP2 family protein [Chitinophagaceae bacterium]|jgi:hypothetical protein|nr:phosphatase PAP2 family protein [Chitinophagaceae bacterium]
MNSRLVVDDSSQLRESRSNALGQQPLLIKLLAKMISYIFHPLFIPVYIIWFFIKSQPYLFSGFSVQEKNFLVLRFAVMYTMFPLLTLLLLRGLGFVKTIYLKTQQERIIPYVICMIYYWWMWYVLHNQPEFRGEIVMLALAIFIVSILGLLANIYMKVSMHTMAMGVAAAFVMLMGFSQDISFTLYISITILITGLVSTSRLIASDHTPAEVYTGLLIGVASLTIAYFFN